MVEQDFGYPQGTVTRDSLAPGQPLLLRGSNHPPMNDHLVARGEEALWRRRFGTRCARAALEDRPAFLTSWLPRLHHLRCATRIPSRWRVPRPPSRICARFSWSLRAAHAPTWARMASADNHLETITHPRGSVWLALRPASTGLALSLRRCNGGGVRGGSSRTVGARPCGPVHAERTRERAA